PSAALRSAGLMAPSRGMLHWSSRDMELPFKMPASCGRAGANLALAGIGALPGDAGWDGKAGMESAREKSIATAAEGKQARWGFIGSESSSTWPDLVTQSCTGLPGHSAAGDRK